MKLPACLEIALRVEDAWVQLLQEKHPDGLDLATCLKNFTEFLMAQHAEASELGRANTGTSGMHAMLVYLTQHPNARLKLQIQDGEMMVMPPLRQKFRMSVRCDVYFTVTADRHTSGPAVKEAAADVLTRIGSCCPDGLVPLDILKRHAGVLALLPFTDLKIESTLS